MQEISMNRWSGKNWKWKLYNENKEKQIQLIQLMENHKELEKMLSQYLTENSRLKK